MASRSQNILIFGGTGVIGRYITEALLYDRADFRNIAIFTSPATVEAKKDLLQKWNDDGLEVIVGDMTRDKDVKAAYERFDTVISAVGRNVISEQTSLLKLAEASPTISRFFPSEYGTDIEYNSETSPHEKPHQQKLKVRKYIRDHIKRLDITYLVTGPYADLFLGKSKNSEYGSFDPVAKQATLLGTGDEPISFTTMEDVGKLLIHALKHPREARNKVLKVNSFTATPHQILQEFEAQTGGEKWFVTYTSLPVLKQLEEKAWKENDPSAAVYTLRRIWTEGGTLYETRDNEIIGAEKMDTLQIAVAKAIVAAAKM